MDRSVIALLLCALTGCSAPGSDEPQSESRATLSVAPRDSGIAHVIVVMMENRSFDHLLGWVPGADGQQQGLTYTDNQGQPHPTHELAPDFQGCNHPDPDHSYAGGRIEYDSGACDGWLRAGTNDEYSIGYYTAPDLGFFSQTVPRFTVLDRYFAAIMAETYPNRIYQHAAQTDRIVNTFDISTLPTIWDRLAAAGHSGRYYYSDVPFLALWGAKYLPIGRPLAAFVVDALTGNLPDVAFVDPFFIDESSGTSSDDHPHADIRRGEAFLNLIYTVVTQGPAWRNSVLVINYDEWGGFFDHVPPPTADIPVADSDAGNQDGRLGFRTPALVIAPWAQAATVSHVQFDHTSVLKLIEWRFGLAPLTVRDAKANNLVEVLDFSHARSRPPPFVVNSGALPVPCSITQAIDEVSLSALQDMARRYGWIVYH